MSFEELKFDNRNYKIMNKVFMTFHVKLIPLSYDLLLLKSLLIIHVC